MIRASRDENSRPMGPAPAVVNFDEVAIRPSPLKPFETAESPNRESLALSPCDFCGRKFNATNLSRHVTICARLAHKPKREAFATIAQRLSHVAQEDAVKSVIRQGLEKRPTDEETLREENLFPAKNVKKSSAQTRKKSPVRGARTGADLFREQQKGHSKCQYCERTFREEAHLRHVEFCKTQFLAKQRRPGKEDPRSDLLKRRVQYRPPLPRTNSKESPVRAKKAVSAFFSDQKSAVRPGDLKVPGSQSACQTRMNPPGKSAVEMGKLSGKLQGMVISDYSSGVGVNGQRQRIITPYQERTSPSDYGSGESLLSRTGSVRVKTHNAAPTNGISRQVVTVQSNNMIHPPEYDGSGDGRSVQSLVSRTAALAKASLAAENVHKIYHSGDLLSRTGSVRTTKKNILPPVTPTMPLFSRTVGHNPSAYGALDLEEAIRNNNGGRIKLHATPEYHSPLKSSLDNTKTPTTPAERPYPFNVASAQKEEMMLIHRSNSVRAKNSSDSSSTVDWDTFLKPAVLRTPGTPEEDKYRFFQWEGDRYRAPRQRNPVKLSDFSRNESHINEKGFLEANGNSQFEESFGRKNGGQQWKPAASHAESLEETDSMSDSVSPTSPMGSMNSVKSSAIGSSLSSLSVTQNKINATSASKKASSPSPPKFCHNCGNEFPIPNAAFCCHCGMARLVTRIPI